jgi:hypothetical protein
MARSEVDVCIINGVLSCAWKQIELCGDGGCLGGGGGQGVQQALVTAATRSYARVGAHCNLLGVPRTCNPSATLGTYLPRPLLPPALRATLRVPALRSRAARPPQGPACPDGFRLCQFLCCTRCHWFQWWQAWHYTVNGTEPRGAAGSREV